MTIVTGSNTIIKENLLAQEVIRNLDKDFVILPYANTMYEGEIKQKGDTVSIQTLPTPSWNSATTAGNSISATAFTITKDQLIIDQLITLRLRVTNLEEIQSNLSLATKMAERMTYGQKNELEKFFIKTVVTGAYATNVLGSLSTALTASTVADAVESISAILQESTGIVDLSNTALFISPKIAKLIKQSSYFDGFKEGLDVRRAGFIGRIAGMEVYTSTNIEYKCMIALDRDSCYFAAQMVGYKETEEVDAFAHNLLGEVAFGAKVPTESSKRIALYYYSN